ncbi:tetratricopeptide repeat protein, partial [Prevotella sp. F0091]|uniref:tetratricopeptide repeat protein n=1 Tax=Prevotella sp. F0091 TaxID=1227276 RepID=UPI0025F31F18
LTLTPCNAQRNEKLCCGHKPDSAVIVLNNQAVNAYTNHSNSPDSVKKAMTLLDCAIEKDPDYQLAYANKSEFLRNQGDLTQALETLNAYLKRNPIEPYTLMGAGLLYEMLGNKKEAMNYYKRAEVNFKRLYEKDHDSAHEINRYAAIRLMEGPEKVKALYKAERDHLASNEERRKVNDVFVMTILETPREQLLK